jgi:RNA polymerase sigma-70 factor (ECF subfamily)
VHAGLIAVILVPLRRRRQTALSPDPDAELVAQMQAGNERAFLALVARHHASMLRLASSMLPSAAIAEEVVQDTWLAVLRGIDGFAGRSAFRTWLLRILVNRATTTGMRERRTIAVGDAGPVVDRARFDASGAGVAPPQHRVEDSDERLLAQGLAGHIHAALEELPARQREVVMLRDVDGLSGAEVCAVLEISEANQRVLLHRGRGRLRQALEDELGGG